MNIKKSTKDVSSLLRDKYLTTNLKDTLKIDSNYPPLNKIGGIKYLMPKIKETVYNPLFNKKIYEKIGIKPPNTLLIHGVSGIGKSFIINCISQEYKLPIVKANIENDKEVRESFRKAALLDESILLIENIDSYPDDDYGKSMLQLSESIDTFKGKSIIVVTARSLQSINENIRHFDNSILLRIPTIDDRTEILQALCEKVLHESIDWSEIAKNIPGFIARDINRLLKVATTKAVLNGQDILRLQDVEEAIREMRNPVTSVTFDNVGSLEEVKDELNMSIILPSRFPQKFRRIGIYRPSGILLYGPPGCGKTLLARAVSNMSHCNFLSVKGPELIIKYVGDSEKEIRKLFDKAKQLQPCVLFFDEIDSLCGKRSNNEFENRIVNQILTLLDGLDDRGEVYVIGATNRLDRIDAALMRPGRFDKILEVPLPSREGCNDIFIKSVRGIPVEDFNVNEFDLEGLSGAEIAGSIKEAGILCLRDNFDCEELVISKAHIHRALDKVRRMKKNQM